MAGPGQFESDAEAAAQRGDRATGSQRATVREELVDYAKGFQEGYSSPPSLNLALGKMATGATFAKADELKGLVQSKITGRAGCSRRRAHVAKLARMEREYPKTSLALEVAGGIPDLLAARAWNHWSDRRSGRNHARQDRAGGRGRHRRRGGYRCQQRGRRPRCTHPERAGRRPRRRGYRWAWRSRSSRPGERHGRRVGQRLFPGTADKQAKLLAGSRRRARPQASQALPVSSAGPPARHRPRTCCASR